MKKMDQFKRLPNCVCVCVFGNSFLQNNKTHIKEHKLYSFVLN